MNVLSYKFSKEIDSDLMQFLKIANEQKSVNKFCDLDSYETWRQLLPQNRQLPDEVNSDENINTVPVIDLCSDEEGPINMHLQNDNNINEEVNKTPISDLVFVIKETIQTHKCITKNAKESLLKCDTEELSLLFQILQPSFNSEEIYHLGMSVEEMSSPILIGAFSQGLLIPMMQKEFSDTILGLLNHLSKKYPIILNEKCLDVLLNLNTEEHVFSKYIKKLSANFQNVLLKNFIFTVNKLEDNSITIIGMLINNQIDHETHKKLIEMLSNISEKHSRDKNFGKLLIQLIDALGTNLIHFEQQLKRIIAGHQSIWKSKMEKIMQKNYEDSMLFSQSFRD